MEEKSNTIYEFKAKDRKEQKSTDWNRVEYKNRMEQAGAELDQAQVKLEVIFEVEIDV